MEKAATLQRGAFPLFAYLNVASQAVRTSEKPLFQAFPALCAIADTDRHCIKDGMKIDDILFGENWNNQDIDLKTRCIITVVALISRGVTDSSLKYHLTNAKNHGVTQKEMAAIITHISFYSGWPLSWAAFNMAKEVYDEAVPELTEKDKFQNTIFFPVGEPNPYGQFFDGQSYLAPVSTEQVPVFNVTFEPGCRNHYHIHHAKSGGGQMLICVGGRGYYQEEGKEPVEMTPGKVVNIPANVKHWHGAAPDSWFAHLAIEVDGEETSTEWLEPVPEEEYRALG